MLFTLMLVLFIRLGASLDYPDAKTVVEMAPTVTMPRNVLEELLFFSRHVYVSTPQGRLEGNIMKTRQGKYFFAFRGVEYAKAPKGELRFKPPQPVEPRHWTLDATKDGPVCPQKNLFTSILSPPLEGCLVLNVYSSHLKGDYTNPKRPVIVYFHAGGFYAGSGKSIHAGPEYWMDKEIVLVTPNYRLGPLGFISTGDKEAPGNNGLKDQVQALKWVKQNIELFGGDPDLVTIVGYGAGGISVCLHMISPMSRGLFHRAIAMSGSCTAQWKVPNHQLNLAEKLAKLVGCPTTNSTEIIKCLRTKPADHFRFSDPEFQEFGEDPFLIWLPVIEPDIGEERFLPEDPTEMYKQGKQAQVPLMTGISEYEFVYPAYNVINDETLLEEMNRNFDKVAPISFMYERDIERSKEISAELKKFYFQDEPISNNTVTALAELYADGLIGFGVHRLAQLVAASNINPVYYYRFSYKGRFSFFYIPGTNNTVYGPGHHDELIYLFHKKIFPLFNEFYPESNTVEVMITLWTNFARTGNPTPETPELWTRLTPDNQKYLNINETLQMEEKLYEDRYAKWDELFPLEKAPHHKHGYVPFCFLCSWKTTWLGWINIIAQELTKMK